MKIAKILILSIIIFLGLSALGTWAGAPARPLPASGATPYVAHVDPPVQPTVRAVVAPDPPAPAPREPVAIVRHAVKPMAPHAAKPMAMACDPFGPRGRCETRALYTGGTVQVCACDR